MVKLDAGQNSWDDAQTKCKSAAGGSGDIATVVDIYENAEMRVLFNNLVSSMATTGQPSTAWIGMLEHNGQFAWHNTCPVYYSNFQNLYAKPQQTSACVRMRQDGKWDEASCSDSADFALCESRFGKFI